MATSPRITLQNYCDGPYLTTSIVELNTVGKNSSINRINEKLMSFNEWTAKSIEDRQAMLADLAKEVWKTSLIET